MDFASLLALVAAAVFLTASWIVWSAVQWLWLRPRELERKLWAAGLRGNGYRFPYGDLKDVGNLTRDACRKPLPLSHSITARVVPHLKRTLDDYGGKSKMTYFWFGPYPRVIVMNPEFVKDILSSKFGHFRKLTRTPIGKLLMMGLVTLNGEKWAKHRKIINPAFHVEKLKMMFPAFSVCCDELINRWEDLYCKEDVCEINIFSEFQNFTGDIISRAAFGSSYKEGRRIFELQAEQTELAVLDGRNPYIPGFRFIPTKKNRRRHEIYREICAILKNLIELREDAIRNGEASTDDLLGLLLESNRRHFQEQRDNNHDSLTTEEVIHECKLFYFAGQETTSVLLTWTMIVLSMHPIWQERAREEVLHVFGQNKPTLEGLSQLKSVTMILYEVLRLYPPAAFLLRETYKEMKLGEFTLPTGVQLLLPVILVHHNKEFWGDDAEEFNPERFAEGISKATKNQLIFFPFGWGPRICIGQSFALTEAKMVLARILQRFSFELSPSYAHAPYTVLTLYPQYGAQVILHKL